jgi:hypothetical protein
MPEQSYEDRIRARAYEIWVAEGMPDGREVEHWALAERAIALEDSTLRIGLAEGTPTSKVERVESFGQHADAAVELRPDDRPAVTGGMHQQGIGG